MVSMFGIQINIYCYCFCTAYRERGPYGTRIEVYPGAEFPSSRPLRSATWRGRRRYQSQRFVGILDTKWRWVHGTRSEHTERWERGVRISNPPFSPFLQDRSVRLYRSVSDSKRRSRVSMLRVESCSIDAGLLGPSWTLLVVYHPKNSYFIPISTNKDN